MTIYAMRGNALDYQELDLEIDDFIETFPSEVEEFRVFDFAIENFAMSEYWKPWDTEFVTSSGVNTPIPDVSKWIDASLVLSPKAYRYLFDSLKDYGEFLPINVSNDTYYIFNCLTAIDADEPKSKKQFYEGEEVGVKILAFDERAIENTLIFKSPYQHCLDLFCTERLKHVIEDVGLTGLNFDDNLVNSVD